MKKRLFTATAILALMTTAAFAQFGSFGMWGSNIVYDPTVAGDVAANATHLLKVIELTTQSLQYTENLYSQVLANARSLTGKNGWQYAVNSLSFPSAVNISGASGGWINALNYGTQAGNAYGLATIQLRNPKVLIDSLSAAGQSSLAAHMASIELHDGLAQNTMTVTGTARSNWQPQADALARLNNRSLSEDPLDNNEVAVLNLINGATLAQALSQQDTNHILAAMADQQSAISKINRDAVVSEFNNAAAAYQSADQTNTALWDGDAKAHHTRF